MSIDMIYFNLFFLRMEFFSSGLECAKVDKRRNVSHPKHWSAQIEWPTSPSYRVV